MGVKAETSRGCTQIDAEMNKQLGKVFSFQIGAHLR